MYVKVKRTGPYLNPYSSNGCNIFKIEKKERKKKNCKLNYLFTFQKAFIFDVKVCYS